MGGVLMAEVEIKKGNERETERQKKGTCRFRWGGDWHWYWYNNGHWHWDGRALLVVLNKCAGNDTLLALELGLPPARGILVGHSEDVTSREGELNGSRGGVGVKVLDWD
jgi:hypothetical protein